MSYLIFVIVFYILLIDAIGANVMAWLGGDKWYKRNFRIISHYFPVTKGWTTYYLILVLWIGSMLYAFGVL